MERRPLTVGVNAIPNADPETVRQFITQEQRASATESPAASATELSLVSERATRVPPATDQPNRRRRTKSAGVTPIGLIPVTIRLRPEISSALKRASLERQLHGEDLFTQQDLVEQALEPWLRQQGFLSQN